MSYGGSSLVVNCVAVALLLRIDQELRAPAKKQARAKARAGENG
jgi:cell division protein FtsW